MRTTLPTGTNIVVNQAIHAAYPSMFAQGCLRFTPDPAQKCVLDFKASRAILCFASS